MIDHRYVPGFGSIDYLLLACLQCGNASTTRSLATKQLGYNSSGTTSLSPFVVHTFATKESDMASDDELGISFDFSHSQQSFRLMELPPPLLELLSSDNPPTYVHLGQFERNPTNTDSDFR